IMATSNDGSGWAALILLGIGAYVFFLTDCFVGADKIVDYPVYCEGEIRGDNCSSGWTRGSKTTFSINKEQQIVVGQVDGNSPERLTNCAIVDKENWRCHSKGVITETTLGYTDGKYWSPTVDSTGFPMAISADRHWSKANWYLNASAKKR